MSAEFVDTNILVYAHDTSAGRKRDAARALVERLIAEGTGVLSTQVLMELFVTLTGKLPNRLSPRKASEIVEDFGTWPTFAPTVADILAAAALAERHVLSFWDAMIVRAAQRLDATVLWSEDLTSGQRFGALEVRSPFE